MKEHPTSIDPHGYQPVYIDEGCLNDEERKEAFRGQDHSQCDWRSHLTAEEIEELEKSLIEIKNYTSQYFYCPGEDPEIALKRFEFARLGLFRLHAREKYSQGHPVWYGDKLPFPID